MDATFEILEKDIDKESLVDHISTWLTPLEKQKELKGIAGKLVKLLKAIADKDNKKFVELMTSAGEHIIKPTGQAENDEAKKISRWVKRWWDKTKLLSRL